MNKRWMLLSGLAAAIVYILTVIIGGALYPGYDHIAQFVSELIAAGAPNTSLLNPLFALYNILTAVFGWALLDFIRLQDANPKRKIGVTGAAIIIAEGVLGFMILLFPQDPIGQPITTTGTLHIILAGLSSLASMAGILLLGFWFQASDRLRPYGRYAFISVGFVFIFGGLTAMMTASQNPLSGLMERLTIGGFLQWMAVVSLGLFLKFRKSEE